MCINKSGVIIIIIIIIIPCEFFISALTDGLSLDRQQVSLGLQDFS